MASIRKRSENSYQIIVSRGYASDGTKLTSTKTVTLDPKLKPEKKEKELERLAYEFERQVETGQYIDGGRVSFKEFAERWLMDHAKKQLAPKTACYYKLMLQDRIIPAIGHITLEKLQPVHLIQFYSNLEEAGVRGDTKYRAKPELIERIKTTGITAFSKQVKLSDKTISNLYREGTTTRGIMKKITEYLQLKSELLFSPVDSNIKLSNNTILHYHALISSICSCAVQWQVMRDNPAARVKPPKAEKHEAKVYDEDMLEKLLDILEKEPLRFKAAMYLVIFTGVRLGELCGVEWKDIDLDNNLIRIQRASQYINDPTKAKDEHLISKAPKNPTSNRLISLPVLVTKVLKKYKTWQNELKLSLGDQWQAKSKKRLGDNWIDNDRLFTQNEGEPIFPNTIPEWFRDLRKKYGLPDLTFHQLRHSNASMLIAAGVDVATVSKRLGHANVRTTTTIYSHALKRPDREAAQKLEIEILP